MVEGIQNQLVLSVDEIRNEINKIYQEIKSDEEKNQISEETNQERVKKLRNHYISLIDVGQFKDDDTGRIKDKHEVARTMLEEMDRYEISGVVKHHVWRYVGDDYKRAWRKPIDGTFDTRSGKLTGVSLLDPETKFIYDKYKDAVLLLKDFDYNELPRTAQMMLGEIFYDCYKHHNEEWLKHKITLVKGEQDTHDPTKGDPIRIDTHKNVKDELYYALVELRDVIDEVLPIVKSNPPSNPDKQHKYANAVRGLTAYFIPWKNSKWKKEWLSWINIHIKQMELRSKSGAAKYSKIHVTSVKDGIDTWQGITREEIDKNRLRILRFARDFAKNFPYLAELSEYFMEEIEPVRALHTVKLHGKMSEAAFT